MQQNLTKRFLQFVEKTPTCWLWKGASFKSGYGAFSYLLKPWRAHRISWLIFNGEIPAGKCILHKCDVRKCVRPDHLFIGTYRDNIRDMIKKGRRPVRMNKLSEKEINEIRNLFNKGTPKRELSKKFSVWPQTINSILARRSWKHLAPRPT